MSHYIKIALPEPVAEQLSELAAGSRERPSTLAGHMVRNEVARAVKDGKVRPVRAAPVLVGRKGNGRAPWLEPYGGDRQWRQRMWGEIVALHGRYPRALAHLNDEWWTDAEHTEILCALAVWRAELDDAGRDTRQELAFHNQLSDYAQMLRQEGRGVTKAWKPGAPPDEWTPG